MAGLSRELLLLNLGYRPPILASLEELYRLATLNRIGLATLSSLVEAGFELPPRLERELTRLLSLSREIMGEFARVGGVLERAGVEYAVFKSLRPYPSTTVDIDVLIFRGYWRAYRALRRSGYEPLGAGPESVTLRRRGGPVSVDLYREPAVSRLVYLDREALRGLVEDRETPAGPVKALRREADAVAFIDHSIVKEQLITAADVVTVLKLLEDADLALFHRVVRSQASQACTALFLWASLGALRGRIELPYRVKPAALAWVLACKGRLGAARRSIAQQATYLASPARTLRFLRELHHHLVRPTY